MYLSKINFNIFLEKKIVNACILIENIMQKECVITVITNMAELKNHGIVLIKNYMLKVYAKIVT